LGERAKSWDAKRIAAQRVANSMIAEMCLRMVTVHIDCDFILQ
jgi:hypothetical protein